MEVEKVLAGRRSRATSSPGGADTRGIFKNLNNILLYYRGCAESSSEQGRFSGGARSLAAIRDPGRRHAVATGISKLAEQTSADKSTAVYSTSGSRDHQSRRICEPLSFPSPAATSTAAFTVAATTSSALARSPFAFRRPLRECSGCPELLLSTHRAAKNHLSSA
ncbi:unnamed protein product, partial [Heterotrigona itama]